MESAFIISGIIGTLLLAVGGFLISFGNHKIASIWIVFAGAMCLLLSAALYLHEHVIKENLTAAARSTIDTESPKAMPEKPTPSQTNITSVNQSGNAITAHTVNLGDPKTDARVATLAAEADARAAKEKAEADEKTRKEEADRPYTIIQHGKPVAKAITCNVDEAKGTAFFQEITNSVTLVPNEPFEYRSYLMTMTHADQMIGMELPDAGKGQIIRCATCVIVGRTK